MGVKQLHRIQLHPRGATLSKWQADTLFGHLCWQIYFRDGKSGLKNFIDEFRAETPPFVLSDGFPGDALPRPLVLPAMKESKESRRVKLVTRENFQALLRSSFELKAIPEFERDPQVTLKNQINRLTNTTAGDQESGNLYTVEEFAFYRVAGQARAKMPISVYFWAKNSTEADRVEELFSLLSRGGYGKKKSVGYGQFTVSKRETITLNVPDTPNGIVALANFVPKRGDPTEGSYQTRVKYGKLGEGGLQDDKWLPVFKYPLLMLTAGSTFRNDDDRNYVGGLVAGIHPNDPEIVQYAFAPVVPMRLPAAED